MQISIIKAKICDHYQESHIKYHINNIQTDWLEITEEEYKHLCSYVGQAELRKRLQCDASEYVIIVEKINPKNINLLEIITDISEKIKKAEEQKRIKAEKLKKKKENSLKEKKKIEIEKAKKILEEAGLLDGNKI